jgi:exosome complex RNA-binding protein Rrp4
MKMEEILQETLEEETNELKLQLQQKDNIILEIKQTTEEEKCNLIKKRSSIDRRD